MKRNLVGWTVVVFLAASADSPLLRAQGAPVAHERLPDSLRIPGRHSVLVRRVTADSAARRALEAAERADPPPDAVLASLSKAHFKLRERPADSRLWWSSEFDGVRIPYAITDAAVAYYLALSGALRRGETGGTRGIQMSRSRLEYVATVERHETFALEDSTYAGVHVVRLRLAWSTYCGDLCALFFTHERMVVVDRSGVVRAIRGDGRPEISVS